jgi:hypothetical protein
MSRNDRVDAAERAPRRSVEACTSTRIHSNRIPSTSSLGLKVTATFAHNARKTVTVVKALRVAQLFRPQDDGPFRRSHAFECIGVPQLHHLAVPIGRGLSALLRGHQTPINRVILYYWVTHGRFRERRCGATQNRQASNEMPHRLLPYAFNFPDRSTGPQLRTLFVPTQESSSLSSDVLLTDRQKSFEGTLTAQ